MVRAEEVTAALLRLLLSDRERERKAEPYTRYVLVMMRQSCSSALGMWGLQLSNVGWMTLWMSGQNIASIQGQTRTDPALLLQDKTRTVGTLESRFLLLLESTSHPSVSPLSSSSLTSPLNVFSLLSHCELQKEREREKGEKKAFMKQQPLMLETAVTSFEE